jgi:ribosome-binding factor A
MDPEAGAFEVKRADRVAGGVQRCLAEALLHRVGDPRLADVNLTRVRLTPDLKLANAYFLLLTAGRGTSEEALAGLERAAPFLRRHLARTMQLRYTPALRFFYDEEMEEARRIDALLRETRPESADDFGEDQGDA